MKQFFTRLHTTIINVLSLQLFLSLVSLPILASWGLPLSLMSPIGNVVFSPFLSLFLLLSSLIFFCELAYIPNGWFIRLLELVSIVWHKALSCTYGSVLIAVKKPPFFICLAIGIAAFAVMSHRIMRAPLTRLLVLSALFVACCLLCNLCADHNPALLTIPCYQNKVFYLHRSGQSVLIDPGAMGRRISAPTWVAYTLVPELVKKTGCTQIDHIIVPKPGIVLFDALTALCTTISVKKIYMPWLEGEMDVPLKRAFNRFYAHAKKHEVALVRFRSRSIQLNLDAETSLTIIPRHSPETNDGQASQKPKMAKTYRTITYPDCAVMGIIDNQPVTFYDSNEHVNHSSFTDLPCQQLT